ncbi:MAG: hypothetical protein WCA12_03000, partial [Burkholderiales bacterium]
TFKVSSQSVLHALLLITATQVPWLRVIIVVTINAFPRVLTDGVVTQSSFGGSNDPGASTLTLIGEDLSAVMDQQEYTGVPYPAMPAEARVALIVAKYAVFGMVPIVIPSLFTDVPIPVDQIPAHEGTDLQYVNALAHDAGYTFYVDPGPAPGINFAYWGPDIKVGVPQPALTLGMGPDANVDAIQFSITHTEAAVPVVFVQNALTKLPIPLPIPPIDLLNPPLGLLPPLPKKIEFMQDTAKDTPTRALSKAVARAARAAEAVSANGSVDMLRYGSILRARQLVGVRGAGLAFDGLYFVQSVTSTIKRGEFKQSFTLTRNGIISTVPVVPTVPLVPA